MSTKDRVEDQYNDDLAKQRFDNEQEKVDKEQERVAEDQQYHAEQTNDNVSDPSAKRNIGRGGVQHRDDEKDQLHNLKIQGNEATGYGGNSPEEEKTNQGGPGFTSEGGEYASPPIRNDDQVAD